MFSPRINISDLFQLEWGKQSSSTNLVIPVAQHNCMELIEALKTLDLSL